MSWFRRKLPDVVSLLKRGNLDEAAEILWDHRKNLQKDLEEEDSGIAKLVHLSHKYTEHLNDAIRSLADIDPDELGSQLAVEDGYCSSAIASLELAESVQKELEEVAEVVIACIKREERDTE